VFFSFADVRASGYSPLLLGHALPLSGGVSVKEGRRMTRSYSNTGSVVGRILAVFVKPRGEPLI
jgi:hypothetical protein